MGNYKGLEITGIVVGGAILLSLFVIFPVSVVVAKTRANTTIFGNTGNGPATKRHKRRKNKSKKRK